MKPLKMEICDQRLLKEIDHHRGDALTREEFVRAAIDRQLHDRVQTYPEWAASQRRHHERTKEPRIRLVPGTRQKGKR